MIKTFKDKDAGIIWVGDISRRYSLELQRSIRIKLRLLYYAVSLEDLYTCRLEKLKGRRQHQYSIRVNKQFRICFEWFENNSYNVEIADYHK